MHAPAGVDSIAPIQGPCVLVVCGGRARAAIAGRIHPLRAGQQLTLCVPLELQIESESCASEPLVLLGLRLDLTVVAEMLLALKEPRRTLEDTQRIIAFGASDSKVVDAIERLLDLFCSPRDMQILGPATLREIHFRMLTGAHGDATRAALGHNGRVAKIGRALRRIENEFNTRLSAEALAEEACMCLTSFHENFRAVTGSTPLQYLKSLRLNTARVLMVRDGISAAVASGRVGYESPSQFSREFKRQFGKTPAQFARDSTAVEFHGYPEVIPERHVGPGRPDRLTHRPDASNCSAARSHDSQLEERVHAGGPLMHAAIPSFELRAGTPDRMPCLQSSTHRGL